ncbi:hypothetical protein HZS_4868 [Henneguya salminicola]|nr:hypothetical protein HZS_4868 [Henneguya salminicola]
MNVCCENNIVPFLTFSKRDMIESIEDVSSQLPSVRIKEIEPETMSNLSNDDSTQVNLIVTINGTVDKVFLTKSPNQSLTQPNPTLIEKALFSSTPEYILTKCNQPLNNVTVKKSFSTIISDIKKQANSCHDKLKRFNPDTNLNKNNFLNTFDNRNIVFKSSSISRAFKDENGNISDNIEVPIWEFILPDSEEESDYIWNLNTPDTQENSPNKKILASPSIVNSMSGINFTLYKDIQFPCHLLGVIEIEQGMLIKN